MLCLVNLPNGTTFGIQCDPKAIGQKCLEEVRDYYPYFVYTLINISFAQFTRRKRRKKNTDKL